MASNLQLETKMKIKPDQLKNFFDLHDKIYKGFPIDLTGWLRKKDQQYGARFNSLNMINTISGSVIYPNLCINYVNENY